MSSDKLTVQLDALHERTDKTWERHKALLPKTDDPALTILKGHLMIEEMLMVIAVDHCPHPEHLMKARLTFAQLSYLTRAMVRLPMPTTCWEAIDLLNAIRNALVHNLEPRDLQAKLCALQRLCTPKEPIGPPGYEPPTEPQKIAEQCICYIMGQLSVLTVVATFIVKNLQLPDSAA
jgi:hypothetical protein